MERKIYCCGCNNKVMARMTDGSEVYPHRHDLYELKFWVCDQCHNFVGCHKGQNNKYNPLGCIATIEIKKERQRIHNILDPLWKLDRIKRKDIYSTISRRIGREYHTANIRSIAEARRIYKIVKDIYESKLHTD